MLSQDKSRDVGCTIPCCICQNPSGFIDTVGIRKKVSDERPKEINARKEYSIKEIKRSFCLWRSYVGCKTNGVL